MQDMLTKREAKRLARYLEWLAPALGLGEWRIRLLLDPADDDALASIRPAECQQLATLRLGPGWPTLSVKDRRRALVHELVHCHLDQMAEHVGSAEAVMGAPTYSVFYEVFRQALELATDNIAVAWADGLDDSPVQHLLEAKPR